MIKKLIFIFILTVVSMYLYFQNPYARFIMSNVLENNRQWVEVSKLEIKNGKYYAKISNNNSVKEIPVKLTSPIFDGKTTTDYKLQKNEFYAQ